MLIPESHTGIVSVGAFAPTGSAIDGIPDLIQTPPNTFLSSQGRAANSGAAFVAPAFYSARQNR